MKRIITATKRYIVVFALVLAAVAWVLVMGSRPVSSERTRMRVVIAEGTPASRIASALQDKGLIRSSFVFSLTCRVSGVSSKLKPGVYEFSRAMSLSEIIHHLVNGDTLDSWVTIPEGFTVRQIADLLAGRQLVNSDSFVSLSIDQGSEFAKYPFLDGDSLEGYLFPDTYLVERGSDLGSIITKMLDAFDRKVAHPCRADVERVCRGAVPRGRRAVFRGDAPGVDDGVAGGARGENPERQASDCRGIVEPSEEEHEAGNRRQRDLPSGRE